MDIIVDRILEITEEKLPSILTDITSNFSADDITNYGVELTLAAPVKYAYGIRAKITGLPFIKVYRGDRNIILTGERDADINKMTVNYTLDLHWNADNPKISDRMTERYEWALIELFSLRKFQCLAGASDSDHFAINLRDVPINTGDPINTDKRFPTRVITRAELTFELLCQKLAIKMGTQKFY